MSNITLGLDKKGRCSRTNDEEGEENEEQGREAGQQSSGAEQALGARAAAAAVAMGNAGGERRARQLATWLPSAYTRRAVHLPHSRCPLPAEECYKTK